MEQPIRKLALAGLAAVLAAVVTSCSREAPAPAERCAGAKAADGRRRSAGFDKTVRPQDDLYKHVNGAWLAKTEIPADRGAYGGFYEAIDRTQERLRGIVEAAAKAPNKTGRLRRAEARRLLHRVHGRGARQPARPAPLDPELARIDALATKTDLARHMARMMMLNMTTLVGGGVDGDAQEPDTSVLYLVAERPRPARPRLLPEGRSRS